MLVEKGIEEKVKGFVTDALKPLTPTVKGSWDIAEEGEVKGREEPCGTVLAIAVGLRSYDGFDSPQCDIPCAIVFSVRRDMNPTGSEAVEASEKSWLFSTNGTRTPTGYATTFRPIQSPSPDSGSTAGI